jgi:hypothetical protein
MDIIANTANRSGAGMPNSRREGHRRPSPGLPGTRLAAVVLTITVNGALAEPGARVADDGAVQVPSGIEPVQASATVAAALPGKPLSASISKLKLAAAPAVTVAVVPLPAGGLPNSKSISDPESDTVWDPADELPAMVIIAHRPPEEAPQPVACVAGLNVT